MKKTSKIIVTIVVLFVFFILFGLIVLYRQESGSQTPGILGLVVFVGMLGALREVWKKKKDGGTSENMVNNKNN